MADTPWDRHGMLRVSEDGRFLEHEDGAPFFWMGDTAWQMFAKLDGEEAGRFLADRAAKRFNVIQAQLVSWNVSMPNANGAPPFVDGDPDRPNEAYWKHADAIIDRAASLGLYMALLPAWANGHIEKSKHRKEPPTFTDPESARRYGQFVGGRYASTKHLFWILGGDVRPTQHEINDALAEGLHEGAGEPRRFLMSYHPPGGTFRPPATSSGEFYHEKPWLDFNMIQSGHRFGNRNYERIAEDYARTPVKPTFDSEPCYERHPALHNFENGQFESWHLRRRGYWSVLAGAFGYTYGGNGIWQMDKPGWIQKESHHNYFWYEAIHHEGAGQMKYLRGLFESRPRLVPDQAIVVSDQGTDDDRVQAARSADRDTWIVYITDGHPVELDLSQMPAARVNAWWMNPRNGQLYSEPGKMSDEPGALSAGRQTVTPPGVQGLNNDWVLVMDDAKRDLAPPGMAR